MEWWQRALALVLLVPVSSFFGVQMRISNMAWIWSGSLLADLLFAFGTMGAGAAAWWVARLARARASPGIAFASAFGTGLGLHWAVYAASWATFLTRTSEEEFSAAAAPRFVVVIGWVGIVIASGLIALVAVNDAREDVPVALPELPA